MYKLLKSYFIIIGIITLIIVPSMVAVIGEEPFLTSRISEITEITNSLDSDNPDYFANYTKFRITAEAEILNQADKNQTIIAPDLKLWINASFVNHSLKLELDAMGVGMIYYETFSPGITVETLAVSAFVNQTGLTQLPDGNYTLWRRIEGEELLTTISVTSGILNITYSSFDFQPTDEVNLSFVPPLVFISLFSHAIVVHLRRKARITKRNL